MLVCHCNGVSDRTVRRVVRDGALSVAEVGRACGAGTCCRGCSSTIDRIIRAECHRQSKSSEPTTLPVASATS